MACWITRSCTVGISQGRMVPSGFGLRCAKRKTLFVKPLRRSSPREDNPRPTNGLGPVVSFSDRSGYPRPVFLLESREVLDGHAVDPRSTFVSLHAFPHFGEVLPPLSSVRAGWLRNLNWKRQSVPPCPLRYHSPGNCTLLHRTTAEFTSMGIAVDFVVLCQLVAPCRPSIRFFSISSRFSPSLPSPRRSPASELASDGGFFIFIFGISTGNLNPIYNGPCWAHTNKRHPVGRNGTPEEVGNFCAFLASLLSGIVTGDTLLMDGGRPAVMQD